MGMDVVPTLKRLRNGTTPGASQPSATPTAMAAKIQRGQIAIQKGKTALFQLMSSVKWLVRAADVCRFRA